MSVIPFDQREGCIYFNGDFINWKDAKVHILNHSMHYGSSCFEGIRIYNGKIFKALEHAERLMYSASQLELKPSFTPLQVVEICSEVCKKNNIIDGYIRPLIWRGSEEIRVGNTLDNCNFMVAVWQWPNYSEEKKFTGAKLLLSKYCRPPANSGPVTAKIGGLYVSSTLAKNEATNRNFDDALMLDYRGYVAETSTSNIFFVFNGEIHTPIADCFLKGITRQVVIELAESLEYKVVERHIHLDELKDATDAFFTGTASEISKVLSLQAGDILYEFKESEISHLLLKEYKALVQE
jgi:branched-chain amino acid aminotransferase